MGAPVRADELMARYRVDDQGRVHSDLGGDRAIFAFMRALKRELSREDYAATVQQVLEDVMLKSVRQLLKNNPARHLGCRRRRLRQRQAQPACLRRRSTSTRFSYSPPWETTGCRSAAPSPGCCSATVLRTGLEQRRDLGDLYLGRDFSGRVDADFDRASGIAASPSSRRRDRAPFEGRRDRRDLHAPHGIRPARSWARAQFSQIRRAAKRMICSSPGWNVPSSCRSRRLSRARKPHKFST